MWDHVTWWYKRRSTSRLRIWVLNPATFSYEGCWSRGSGWWLRIRLKKLASGSNWPKKLAWAVAFILETISCSKAVHDFAFRKCQAHSSSYGWRRFGERKLQAKVWAAESWHKFHWSGCRLVQRIPCLVADEAKRSRHEQSIVFAVIRRRKLQLSHLGLIRLVYAPVLLP